jgi:hypothetical protein
LGREKQKTVGLHRPAVFIIAVISFSYFRFEDAPFKLEAMGGSMKSILFLSAILSGLTAQAAPSSDHFYCNAAIFFSRLKTEVRQTPSAVLVNLSGLDGEMAVRSIGMKKGKVLQLEFPMVSCTFSSSRLAVVGCSLNSTGFPPAVLEARALDGAGAVLDHLSLSVADFEITQVVRTHAGSASDISTDKFEARVFLISQKENSRRVMIQQPFELDECEKR